MTKFYLVYYCKDGSIHLLPQDTKEECQKVLTKMLSTKATRDRYDNAMIIKRNLDAYDKGYIFGHMDTPIPEAK